MAWAIRTIWLTSCSLKSIKATHRESIANSHLAWCKSNWQIQAETDPCHEYLRYDKREKTHTERERERETEGNRGRERERARRRKQSASKAVGRMRNAQLTNLIRQTLRHTQSCVCVCVLECIYSCACVCACGHRKISFMTMHKNVA